MAPTEVLAVQHMLTAERLLDGLGVELCLLTGDVPKKELDARRQRIAAGEPLIAIGTHALLYAEFSRLLVAVDRRAAPVRRRPARGARRLAPTPHVLHMTATPIPRSLALTLYGDLDVTVLDELPAGRHAGAARGTWPESKREDGYRWIVEQVQAGRQAYIVCPLVEGSSRGRGARCRGGGHAPGRGAAEGGLDRLRARADEGRRPGRADAPVRRRRPRRAGRDDGDRGRRRRAERLRDGDRGRRPVRALAAAPAARAGGARGGAVVLLPVRVAGADARTARAGCRRWSSTRAASTWPRSTSTCAARATCWASCRAAAATSATRG